MGEIWVLGEQFARTVKGRFLLQHLHLGMPHQDRVEKRCSGTWEADEENRAYAAVADSTSVQSSRPFRRRRFKVSPDCLPINGGALLWA